jgi:hypothetical protein
MKKTIITLLILINSSIWAAAQANTLFSCYVPINPYDSSFSQGDELFLDIEIDENETIELAISAMGGPTFTLPTLRKSEANATSSTFSGSFENGYLSMVYLGGKRWGAFVSQKSFDELDSELEFMCREKELNTFFPL